MLARENSVMKYIKTFLIIFIPSLLISCIKDEQLDTNADILEAYIPSEFLKTDPIITNTSVEFKVKPSTDLAHQSPFFIISPNAQLSPPNGTTRDYTKSQEVYVTAQDNRWVKKYTVTFTKDELSTLYTFNNAELVNNNRYYEFYELDTNGNKIKNWASGNDGYATVAGKLPPEDYPTTIAKGRKNKQAVRMQTVYTSKSGEIAGNPIAAGNLFLGSFKLNFLKPIKSTKFGLPYDKTQGIPTKLRGYFKYKAGKQLTNEKYAIIPNKKDTFDIYAILFEAQQKNNFLSGDHNFSDPRNIAIARLDDTQKIETIQWTEFETPFFILSGKSLEKDKEYMLAIVMTSSIEGAEFIGAVGSTLDIDEVELVFDKN